MSTNLMILFRKSFKFQDVKKKTLAELRITGGPNPFHDFTYWKFITLARTKSDKMDGF